MTVVGVVTFILVAYLVICETINPTIPVGDSNSVGRSMGFKEVLTVFVVYTVALIVICTIGKKILECNFN